METKKKLLNIKEISSYIKPVICDELITYSASDLHKLGIRVYSPVFDFIKFVSKNSFAFSITSKYRKSSKSDCLFKKIWLYCFKTAFFPYNKTRYENLLTLEKIDNTAKNKVIYDFMRENLSDLPLPVMTETFDHFRRTYRGKDFDSSVERFYYDAVIDRDWRWLEDHLYERKEHFTT